MFDPMPRNSTVFIGRLQNSLVAYYFQTQTSLIFDIRNHLIHTRHKSTGFGIAQSKPTMFPSTFQTVDPESPNSDNDNSLPAYMMFSGTSTSSFGSQRSAARPSIS
jgi:hypothetical protein